MATQAVVEQARRAPRTSMFFFPYYQEPPLDKATKVACHRSTACLPVGCSAHIVTRNTWVGILNSLGEGAVRYCHFLSLFHLRRTSSVKLDTPKEMRWNYPDSHMTQDGRCLASHSRVLLAFCSHHTPQASHGPLH